MNRRFKLSTVIFLVLLVVSSPGLTPLSAQVTPAAYDPNELSHGLYWFGLNGANQKFESGVSNPYFDPAKPTLIFAHGWQPFLSNNLLNFDFDGTDTAAGWINAGWNVGIFAWNQFSDETTGFTLGGSWFPGGAPPQGVVDAEAKIWTPNGPRGMRWRDWDDVIDNYSDAPPGTPSAAELFYQTYVAAMTDQTYTGGHIRVAGHSLGNQMAVRLTKLVNDGIATSSVPEHLRPTRVALLDPYWSSGTQTYLSGKTTGAQIREYVAELVPTGTLFEWYWSSNWTTPPEGEANDTLKPMTMYAAMDAAYATNDKDKHMAAQHLYFWSYTFAGPGACSGEDCLNMTKVLAKMSDAQLAAVMRSDYRWAQNAGHSTRTPQDDTYQSSIRSDAPYTVTQLIATPITQTVGGTITVTATVTDKNNAQAGDGTLVAFATDLGTITARSVVSGGAVLAHVTSNVADTAHISATTRGAGGTVQRTLTVTFTEAVSECTSLTGAAIEGPVGVGGTLYVDTPYTFNAVLTPTGATTPITYTWSPTPTSGPGQASVAYQWAISGTYIITLTAENCGGPVEAPQRVVTVADWPYRTYLPLVMRDYG